jgi:hypothetical protein
MDTTLIGCFGVDPASLLSTSSLVGDVSRAGCARRCRQDRLAASALSSELCGCLSRLPLVRARPGRLSDLVSKLSTATTRCIPL